jgi:transcriptional regulator with XRE-family HTH domain
MYSKSSHKQAELLRGAGKSLKEIATALGIAKSTASYWLTGQANKGAFGEMTRNEWLAKMRVKSLIVRRQRSNDRQTTRTKVAVEEVKSFQPTLESKKAILSMLYWAEGAKSGSKLVNFANTDPLLIKLFVRLFRDCYQLDETKFRLRLHLHKYHNEHDAKEFWSTLTQIPIDKIGKIYWKKEPNSGKRYRQNFKGICFLRYNSVELQRQIIAHYLALGEKLTK